MRLVFAGTPQAAVPSLRALLSSPRHEVLAVVTRPDARSGRGRRLSRSPVGLVADEHGIETLTPTKASEPGFLDRLRELAPDACPAVAYGALLREDALAIPEIGWVNLHFSLLPAWRGAAPVQAAIGAGDDLTGASTFRIVPELDAGPIYGTVTEPVESTDTAGTLLHRLASSGADLLVSTMDGIANGTLREIVQPEEGVSFAPKVETADAKVSFAAPAPAVDCQVRSVTPDPGAWTEFRGHRLKLGPVSIVDSGTLPVGELVVERDQVLVGTMTAPVRLDQVKAEGKQWMAALDWTRGTRIDPGEHFS